MENSVKNYLKQFCVTLSFTSLLFIFFVSSALSQNKDISLSKMDVKINLDVNIWIVIHELANRNIPIGFEAADGFDVDDAHKSALKDGTLEEILNAVVAQNPTYTWVESDGIINIFPMKNRDKKISNLLSQRIEPIVFFALDDRATVVEKLGSAFDKDCGVEFDSRIGRGNHLGLPDNLKETLALPTMDLKSVLNKVTKLQEFQPLWTVTRSSSQKSIVVYF